MNPEDALVSQISRWLAGHIDDAALLAEIEGAPKDELGPEQARALEELVAELVQPGRRRGQLQMVARETLEALALGG